MLDNINNTPKYYTVECPDEYRPVLDKINMNGVYKCNPKNTPHPQRIDCNNPFNQNYGIYLPFWNSKNKKVYMIDTYHIHKPSANSAICEEKGWNTLNYIDFAKFYIWQNLEVRSRMDLTYFINECIWDCYYNSSSVINSENDLSRFELICDLTEVDVVRSENAIEYDDEDTFGPFMLYREQHYPSGIDLVRKDAEPTYDKLIRKCINEMYSRTTIPSAFTSIEWNYEKLQKLLDDAKADGIEIDRGVYRNALFAIERECFINKQKREYLDFEKSTKERLEKEYPNIN